MRWLTASLTALLSVADRGLAAEADSKKNSPPLFFLQDPADSLCLSGEEFKRCSIDTLFYVDGSHGHYQIHKRSVEAEDADDDGTCLTKKSCNENDPPKVDPVRLAKCAHCGAKDWNIIGDAESGYVVTHSEGAACLGREKSTNKVFTAPCDSEELPYATLQLQFASAADIAAMSSPAARLIGASSDGDKKLIQSLLKDGVDVNVRDWDDLTALIPAASAGHLDVCNFLLKEGADVNAKDKDGITALMEASIMGHTKLVELLLDNGAEIEATANSQVTALWLAAGEGKTAVMNTLLSKGADATNTRVDGISALMTASIGNHVDAVRLLLDHGADPSAGDGDGLTPLMNAAESGNLAVVKLLVEASKEPIDYMNTISATGYNAMIVASAHGHADVIEYLLDAGADVNSLFETEVTPLMYAASAGHIGVMKLLLDKAKVDVNARHSRDGTAFMEASTGDSTEAMLLLLERGASCDFRDEDGVTPLMAVASLGYLKAQTIILDALEKSKSKDDFVAHINLASFSGGTSVMFSAAGGHLECTKQLIEKGANVNDVAKATPDYLVHLAAMIEEGTVQPDEPHVDGLTAIHVAAQGGYLDCVELLIESGANVGVLDEEGRSPLLLAVKGNHGDVAIALAKAGADPNTPYIDDDGVTHNLLMDAITVENNEFASLLIDSGADLYYADEKKVSTLLQASHRGLTDVVKVLLDKHGTTGGPEQYLNDASDEGVTPVIAAASEGHVEVLKLLLAVGASVDSKDKDETNALMAAAARGHLDAVQVLLDAGITVNDQNTDGHTALMFAYNGKNQVETLWERYRQFVAESDGEDADDGGTGPIIREALDKHTALVELLMKSGANASLKDKEGHTAKDFDFHPDADAEVLAKEMKVKASREESANEL